jgi:hypothetical protein
MALHVRVLIILLLCISPLQKAFAEDDQDAFGALILFNEV